MADFSPAPHRETIRRQNALRWRLSAAPDNPPTEGGVTPVASVLSPGFWRFAQHDAWRRAEQTVAGYMKAMSARPT